LSASSFFKLSQQEVVVEEWEILNDDSGITLGDILLALFGLLFCVLPGLMVIFHVLTRPKRKGHLCLTNWRCLYLEQANGWFKNYHRVDSLELEDIVAVHSVFEATSLGGRSLTIRLHSQHEDSLSINVGDGGQLKTIPFVGKLLRRDSLGKDTLAIAPVLYNRIVSRVRMTANKTSGFNR